MPWPRLWPLLKSAPGAVRTRSGFGVPRIVNHLAKGEIPHRLPYRQQRGWAGACQLVIDYVEPLVPFRDDFNALHEQLEGLRGGWELEIIVLPHSNPLGRLRRYRAGQEKNMDSYSIPASVTPVLVLSDLGCLDRGEARRWAWHRLGRRLRRAGCAPKKSGTAGLDGSATNLCCRFQLSSFNDVTDS